jgi:hypothetical protein
MTLPILYKYSSFLAQSNHLDFDKTLHPGAETPHSGVYRCVTCGKEATSILGRPLPPQNHHQHPGGGPILWQLAVWG